MTDKKKDVDDFGFSFEDEADNLPSVERLALELSQTELEAEVERLRGVNREILKRVTVLMNNLKKNPDKPMIKWPNRVEAIDKFLSEIIELHNPKKDNE